MVNSKIISYVNKLIYELQLTDYIGVLVYGSYVGERNNELSDLDVMIIKENYDTQDCGSLIIDGVRVEYFIQDLKRLYELIRNEINNNDPSHLTKFVTCELLYDEEGKVNEFLKYAKDLYNIKIKPSFDDNDKFSIFSLNNRMEDLESLINKDSFYAVYYVVLEKIRMTYSKINGIIDLPMMKIEKLYSNSDFARKYIASNEHKLPSQDFIDLYLNCMKINDKNIMFDNLKKLYDYSFGSLDFNPNNFSLKFEGKAPFKV